MQFKRFAAIIAAALIFCGMISVSAAAKTYSWLTDDLGILSSTDYLDAHDAVTAAADLSGISTAVIITDLGQDDDNTSRRSYAEDYYNRHFASSDGAVILIVDIDPDTLLDYLYIYLQGSAYDLYDSHIRDVYSDMSAAIEAGGVGSGIVAFADGLYAIADGSYGGSDNTAATPAFKGVLSDLEGKFTSAQISELTELLTDTANDIECNIGVVLTDDLCGKSDRAYADAFLDSTFGVGSSAVVLLYNDDRSNMNYTDWISANGRGTDLYGNRTDDIFDYAVYAGSLGVKKDVYPASDYYESIQNFCRYLSNHKTADYNDSYVTDFNIHLDTDDIMSFIYFLFVPAVIGIIISITVTTKVCRSYTRKKPVSAAAYLSCERTRYLNRTDVFVREYTTHVRISSSSSGSHGGSGHRSGGGGHHSGRSGGGGRRR